VAKTHHGNANKLSFLISSIISARHKLKLMLDCRDPSPLPPIDKENVVPKYVK
jgi:hypothetical protein